MRQTHTINLKGVIPIDGREVFIHDQVQAQACKLNWHRRGTGPGDCKRLRLRLAVRSPGRGDRRLTIVDGNFDAVTALGGQRTRRKHLVDTVR